MRSPLRLLGIAATVGLICFALAGCGGTTSGSSTPPPPPPSSTEPNNCKTTKLTSPTQPEPTATYAGASVTGVVRAGNLPIIGASVQLYAAGASGNGSAPTALVSPITTDASGSFAIPSYTCPFSNSVLYVVSRGGHAGASGAANSGAVLISALATCSTLHSPETVLVNERTTVAATWAMSQFLTAGAQIGATSTNAAGLASAAKTARNMVSSATGGVPGELFPATGTAPVAKINTLANVLNACIVSSGQSSSACTQLYSAAALNAIMPNNTLDAAMNIAQHAGANAAAIYSLASASAAYSPALTAAPSDWTFFVNYAGGGMNAPTALSIDSQGNIWVANYFSVASLFSNTGVPSFAAGIGGNGLLNSYGGAVDVNDTMWIANEQSASSINAGNGSLTLLGPTTNSPATYTAGGLNFPIAVAFDTSGVAWVVDYGNSHLTLLDGSGTPLSGSAGYTASNLIFPLAVATDSKCNAYVANGSSNTVTQVLADGSKFTDFTVGNGPAGVAVDAADNVWVANFHDSSVALVSSAGKALSGSGFTGGALNQPQGIAIDGAGNAWVASYRGAALTELAAATSSTPGAFLSPASGWAPDANLVEPYAVAIDASGNVWVTNYGSNTLTEFIGLAAPVKTPLLGPVRTP